MNKVELSNVVGGALQEKFNKAFERVIDNLQDQNTSFKVKRAITIKLTFEQNEERDDVSVSVDVQEKLAPADRHENLLCHRQGSENRRAVCRGIRKTGQGTDRYERSESAGAGDRHSG